VNIGCTTSGAIMQTAAITRPAATALHLISGGDIAINGGTLDSTGGNICMSPGGGGSGVFTAAGTAVDVCNGASGTLSMGGSSQMAFNLNSAVVNTGYNQLNFTGTLDLTGANLVITGNYTPLPGQTYVLINNNGSAPVAGTFNGLPEHATVLVKGV